MLIRREKKMSEQRGRCRIAMVVIVMLCLVFASVATYSDALFSTRAPASSDAEKCALRLADDICAEDRGASIESRQEARKAEKDLRKVNQKVVARLLEYLDIDREHRHFMHSELVAINHLKQYHSREVIVFCLAHLDYSAEMVVTELRLFNGYPCAMALDEIGAKAMPELLNYVTASNEELSERYIDMTRKLMLSMYDGVPQPENVVFSIVEQRLKETKNRRNLKTLYENIDHWRQQLEAEKAEAEEEEGASLDRQKL